MKRCSRRPNGIAGVSLTSRNLRRLPLRVSLLLALCLCLWSHFHESIPPVAPITKGPSPAGGAPSVAFQKEPIIKVPVIPSTATADAESLAVAHRRVAILRRLCETDPDRAMREALSWSEWITLPEPIRNAVEKPISWRANLDVFPACGGIGKVSRELRHQGIRYEAFVTSPLEDVLSQSQGSIHGVLLGDRVLLGGRGIVPMEEHTADAVAKHLGVEISTWNREDGSGIREDEEAIGLVGGEVFAFASKEERAEVDHGLMALMRSPNPRAMALALQERPLPQELPALALTAASSWTETEKRVLAIRVDFSDEPGEAISQSALETLLVQASDDIEAMAYGKTFLTSTVTPEVFRLPQTAAYYVNGGNHRSGELADDAKALASAAGYTLTDYDIHLYAFGAVGFPYTGLGNIGGGDHWNAGYYDNTHVLVHEFGHNYGVGHASFWQTIGGRPMDRSGLGGDSPIEHEEYGDIFDPMGDGGLPEGQFNMYLRRYLNWISEDNVIKPMTSGIYRIYAFDHPEALEKPTVALQLQAGNSEHYWVGLRRAFPGTDPIANSASVVWAFGGGRTRLLDMTQGSLAEGRTLRDDRTDAGLPVGASFTDPTGAFTLKTVAQGGTGMNAYLDMEVIFHEEGGLYRFFTDTSRSEKGLLGSYVNGSLRGVDQPDWRVSQSIAGQRVDSSLEFTGEGWGNRTEVGITGGTDANWEHFSVQWDGVIDVKNRFRLATSSGDSSRFWIDLNGNGSFESSELVNNHWGAAQGDRVGDYSNWLTAGLYAIRVQYEEEVGGNRFRFVHERPTRRLYDLFTSASELTKGLVGSYIDQSLRAVPEPTDWRVAQSVAGTRIDPELFFVNSGWGNRSAAGLTKGSDADWEDFSVQWDGFIRIHETCRLVTRSDDGSRFWIDLNGDGDYEDALELTNNHWGSGQGETYGELSSRLLPGLYAIRVQYEEGGGGNVMGLSGFLESSYADSTVDWSGRGTQGEQGWSYGYRSVSAGEGNDYDPVAAFTHFVREESADWWNGEQWDYPMGDTPWTQLGRSESHPNGTNSGEEQWAIRRWHVDVTEPTAVAIGFGAESIGCDFGDGYDVSVYLNGQEIGNLSMPAGSTERKQETIYATIAPGDLIDLVHKPRANDTCDRASSWMRIESPRLFVEGQLDYGPVILGQAVSLPLIISNRSETPVTIDDIDRPAGIQLDWTGGEVPPFGTQVINATLAPSTSGSYDGQVLVRPMDPLAMFEVPITGFGQQAGEEAFLYAPSTAGSVAPNVNGAATSASEGIILTPAEAGQAGSVWFDQPIAANKGFTARVDVSISDLGIGGADGFVVAMQNHGTGNTTLLGGNGDSRGFYAGPDLTNTLAIEFDSWNANHAKLIASGNRDQPLDSLAFPGYLEQDVNVSVRVDYDPAAKQLSATVGDRGSLMATVDLPAIIGGSNVMFGVTAGTGGAFEKHVLTAFRVSTWEVMENRGVEPANSLARPDGFTAHWETAAGVPYALEYTPNLSPPQWRVIAERIGTGNVIAFTDEELARISQARGFYRIVRW